MDKTGLLPELAGYLCCPDDRAPLDGSLGLQCPACGRQFEVLGERIIDLRPLASAPFPPGSMDERYTSGYLEDFAAAMSEVPARPAWGADIDTRALRLKQRHVKLIRRLVCEAACADRDVLCDFSGGAGYYTLGYADQFRYVLHCDLSPASLHYTAQRAAARGKRNIIFLRIDYLRPPFQKKLDRVLCLDSLIRSPYHEVRLLQSIAQSLARDGRAVVDFHNYWHNPLRRIGVLHNNFAGNRSYSRSEAEALLRAAGIGEARYVRFCQELPPDNRLGHLFPATRHVYQFHARA